MTTELGFRLNEPAVSEQDVAVLIGCLRSGTWFTARELVATLAITDRELRAIAEASNGRIVSGQKGYALIDNCTPAEIDHAASWLESQGKKMLLRAAKIRARFHRYGGQPA